MNIYVLLFLVLFKMGLSERFEDPVEPLCDAIVRTVFPKTIKNAQDETKHIVNDDLYKQAVVSETCTAQACDRRVTFPVGYEGVCVQKYSKVRLLTVGPDGQPVFDTFLIPSSCSCGIKRELM